MNEKTANAAQMHAQIMAQACTPENLLRCPTCSGSKFDTQNELYRVSRLLTGAHADGLITKPVNVCKDCGHVLRDSEIKKILEKGKNPLDLKIN